MGFEVGMSCGTSALFRESEGAFLHWDEGLFFYGKGMEQ
jgi:hypothetical protein